MCPRMGAPLPTAPRCCCCCSAGGGALCPPPAAARRHALGLPSSPRRSPPLPRAHRRCTRRPPCAPPQVHWCAHWTPSPVFVPHPAPAPAPATHAGPQWRPWGYWHWRTIGREIPQGDGPRCAAEVSGRCQTPAPLPPLPWALPQWPPLLPFVAAHLLLRSGTRGPPLLRSLRLPKRSLGGPLAVHPWDPG